MSMSKLLPIGVGPGRCDIKSGLWLLARGRLEGDLGVLRVADVVVNLQFDELVFKVFVAPFFVLPLAVQFIKAFEMCLHRLVTFTMFELCLVEPPEALTGLLSPELSDRVAVCVLFEHFEVLFEGLFHAFFLYMASAAAFVASQT